jgi:beta-galactosidase
MRGLKRQNVWVMEQQAGPSGWETVSTTPRPGELRLWAYQSIAHGADGIVFFRWRTARFGTEEYWHGLLDHHGRPGRRYEEIKRMGGEIKKAGEQLHGSTVKPSVAMILSYDSRFAFHVHRSLYRRQVPVDIVAPTDDLSAYKLVAAPALHVVSDAAAENLGRFVQTGGVLVVTPRTGVKDEANGVVNQPLPGLLAELCGVAVEEYDSLPPGVRNQLEFALPELGSPHPVYASVWCDVLESNGATVIARYTQDYTAGKPAITVNQLGQGQVVYVGTVGDADLYEALADWLLGLAGVEPVLPAPEGVEVTERWQGASRLLFVLNHTGQAQEVDLNGHYVDILSGSASEGTVTIAPREVLVLLEA